MPITVSSLLFYYVVKKLDAKLLGQLLRGIFFYRGRSKRPRVF